MHFWILSTVDAYFECSKLHCRPEAGFGIVGTVNAYVMGPPPTPLLQEAYSGLARFAGVGSSSRYVSDGI